MSEYMMMPGARLEVGPGGKPYETLGGACCSSCASGGPCASSLGAAPGLTAPKRFADRIKDKFGSAITRKPPVGGGSPPAGSGSSSNTKYYVAGAAALGLVAVMFLRKKKR